jgi:hypothetical protein
MSEHGYFDGEGIIVIGLIVLVIAVVAFFAWLFWTFSGMLMDYTGTTKYGWVFQLTLTLIVFGIVGGIGRVSSK